ncbi:MAG: hypothetical protein ACYS7Y_25180 [Planctomycetota bacterium]|jgi:hypothetical protein
MSNVQTNLEQLDLLLLEKQYHLKVLGLWAHIDEHLGKEIRERVKTFTFRDAYLSDTEESANIRARLARRPIPYSGKTHHNALRLDNNDVILMPLIERPEPPDHMRVNINKVIG